MAYYYRAVNRRKKKTAASPEKRDALQRFIKLHGEPATEIEKWDDSGEFNWQLSYRKTIQEKPK